MNRQNRKESKMLASSLSEILAVFAVKLQSIPFLLSTILVVTRNG